MEKMFVVVKVTDSGSGNISGKFPQRTAIDYYNHFIENMKESGTNGFVKIFDMDGNEQYIVEGGNLKGI